MTIAQSRQTPAIAQTLKPGCGEAPVVALERDAVGAAVVAERAVRARAAIELPQREITAWVTGMFQRSSSDSSSR